MTNANSPFDEGARKENAKENAKEQFKESIHHISGDDLSDAVHQGEEKFRRLEQDIPSTLQSVWNDLKLLLAMLRDYVRGTYREIPFGSIAAIGAAVLYFVSPIDSIPDFIPGLGYIDDAAVLMLCLKMVRKDVEEYRQWAFATTA